MGVGKFDRRKFLGQASCAGLGYLTAMNSIFNLRALNAAAISNSSVIPQSNDYKALVCILQAGGNDSFNMLIPKSTTKYNEYAATRTNLAIPQADVLAINANTSDGHSYGLHPSMTGVQNLFNAGKLSFVSNVGTLMDYITKTQFLNNSAAVPLGLFSHADQIQQWQTAIKDERTAVGWGGKISDLIGDQNNNPNISMNISLAGTNLFQTGTGQTEFAIDRYSGSIGIDGHDPNSSWIVNQLRTAAIDSMMEHQYQDMFKQTYSTTLVNAIDSHLEFQAALATFSGFNTVTFADNYFSKGLEMIAKTIAVRQQLNMSRQTFFLNFGGWDHHDEVLNAQTAMLGIMSDALENFSAALEELGVADDVVTFTISEFARTLTSNGNGTDHAWGGNVMAMSGANTINGSQIFGTYPSLTLDGSLDVGDGVLIPTTATDSYFAELAMWFGVANSDLSFLYPELGNFYSIGSSTPPIGFLNI